MRKARCTWLEREIISPEQLGGQADGGAAAAAAAVVWLVVALRHHHHLRVPFAGLGKCQAIVFFLALLVVVPCISWRARATILEGSRSTTTWSKSAERWMDGMDGWPGELSCQNKGKQRERLYTRELQAILVVAYFQHRLGMPSPGLTRTRSTLVFLARARRRRRFRSLALSCLCLLPVNQLITCRLLACVGTSLSMCRSWAKTSAFSHIFSHHHLFFFCSGSPPPCRSSQGGWALFPTGADLARCGSASHVTTSWIFF